MLCGQGIPLLYRTGSPAAPARKLIKMEHQMSHLSVHADGLAPYRRTPRQHVLLSSMHMLQVWIDRRLQRQALAALDDRLLDDVGLSLEQARREAAKPFWKR